MFQNTTTHQCIKRRLQFHCEALNLIIIFSVNTIQQIQSYLDNVKTGNIIKTINSISGIKIKRYHGIHRIVATNILKQFDGYVKGTNDDIRQRIIENINNFNLENVIFNEPDNFESQHAISIITDDDIEFINMCILLTNWVFDCAKNTNHIANSYTTYELVTLLSNVIEYFTTSNDGGTEILIDGECTIDYLNFNKYIKPQLLKNIFSELPIAPTSFKEMHAIVAMKHKFITDSVAIYKCNHPPTKSSESSKQNNHAQKQYINNIVKIITTTINDLDKKYTSFPFNIELVQKTVKQLVDIQVKYFYGKCDRETTKKMNMFEPSISVVDYFLTDDSNCCCVHSDYVGFKEKLLLVFVHDRLFENWNDCEDEFPTFSEKMLVDDAIVYQIVKFQQ